MLKFSLRQLEYFAKAAEVKSLAKAARELHISQPSISAAIGKLETALGVQLFVRHHAQGISLTSAGRRIAIEVNALLAHANEVSQHARGLAEQMRGRLRIGCFGPIASLYLPKVITEFQQIYPDVELHLYEDNNDTLFAGVATNRYDVAIVYKLDVPPNLQATSLKRLRPHIILPSDHPLVALPTIELSTLVTYPMVLLDLPRSHEYFVTLFTERGLQPQVSLRSPSFETVRALVANGAGFSVLVTRPQHPVCYDGKLLIEKEIADDIPLTEIALVHAKPIRPTRLLSVFIQHCQQYFAR